MRLIRNGALDRAGARRSRQPARHRRRVISIDSSNATIGASPLQVARTLRVQRAKRLLDQTKLPMADVAARAGFASLRRFNAVFAEVYKRTPSDVRRLRFKPV